MAADPGGALTDDAVADLLERTAAAVSEALGRHLGEQPDAWRDRGDRPGQYRLDLVADEAALGVLRAAGVGILSEESGLEGGGSALVVVVDPVDGSTNASRHLPWYAVSLCAVDDDGPRVALVRNLATGTSYRARRGGGATRDGRPVRTSPVTDVDDAVVVLNGYAGAHFGWRQYRALGASALDLCAVADGSVDGTVDCTVDALGPWDYLASSLVLTEAGGRIADARGRDLVVLDHAARRTPVSAGTPRLFEALMAARRDLPPGRPTPPAAV
jgi:fructose-1,6-bisphosphatase/inositol monophosphatase family enzyme